MNLFVAALLLCVGAAGERAFFKYTLHEVAIRDALRNQGSETSGRVTVVSMAHRRVYYSFSIDGTNFTGESNDVPVDGSMSLHVGDSLPIRYIAANPSINHAAAWEDSPYSGLGTSIFWAMPIFMGLMLVRRFPLQRRLAMNGIAARGCIAKTEWYGPSRGQRYANYTFRNLSTDEVEIGSCPDDNIYAADSDCWVLYMPAKPRQSEIYPFPIDFFRIKR